MGEKEFLAAIGGFQRDFSASGAAAKDFLESIAAHSSIPLEKLFREWITGVESSSYILDGLTFEQILKKYR